MQLLFCRSKMVRCGSLMLFYIKLKVLLSELSQPEQQMIWSPRCGERGKRLSQGSEHGDRENGQFQKELGWGGGGY
jgi:hypothetical protein